MKRASMALLLLTFSLFFLAFTPTYTNATVINAKTASPSADIKIDQVTHTVKIQPYGSVIINDTLTLSPKNASTVLIQNLSIGFPFKYGVNLDYCFAYGASNPDELFKVELDVGLGGRIGFYGMNVAFPEPVDIRSGGSYNLTVVFVFSNLVSQRDRSTETETPFNLDFPMYPSLTQNASLCNVTVVLPPDVNAQYESSDFDFNVTTLDPFPILNHTKRFLDSFQHKPASLNFTTMGYMFRLINVNEIKREIKLDQWGGIHLSDLYHITNKGSDALPSITVSLPLGAHDISAWDDMGSLSVSFLEKGNATIPPNAVISFGARAVEKDQEKTLTVTYRLPWKNYVNHYNGHYYDLAFTFFEQFDWTIRKLYVSIILPEGAEFESSNPSNLYSIENSVFQETVTFAFSNVTPFHDLSFDLTYGYLVFWASFYPTLWMGILVIVVCVIALLWRAPRPPPVPIIPVPPENLKSFVEAYEEKTRILLELESMEGKLRKGRIPRHRYKVRKKMLEGRLSTLSRDLTDLREKIRAAGGSYANIMRQIEVAETMLEGAKTDIRRIEARYSRGEISKGAYRRLLQEYHQRSERANITIDGVLLRLREEIR